MLRILVIIALAILIPGGFVGLIVVLGARSLKKELDAEDNEQLIPFPIHGSRVMLTSTEYAAHLDDQLDTANLWAAKLLRDTKD